MNIPFPISQAVTLVVLALFVLAVRTIALRVSARSSAVTELGQESVTTEIQVSVTHAGIDRSWNLRPGASRKQVQNVADEVVHEILT
jgi:hypothetical protein